jgi:glycerate kinase
MKIYLKGIHGEGYTEDKFNTLASTKGTGASGGLVAALLACFGENAVIQNGMEFITKVCHLEEKIKESAIVFTGEGSIDD